jgi:malate dehydrogenase (oxaloacetate-decarboxylating)
VGKELADCRVVMSGAGAAGTAILKLLLRAGATDVVVADHLGVLHRDRADIASGEHPSLAWSAEHTNRRGFTGTLKEALAGADVFIGVSAPGILTGDDIATMNEGAIVFAMANPEPEVHPMEAARHAAVVATGRSDFANQINNVLVFPGVFRGLLDAASTSIDIDVMLAAAKALSEVVHPDELNAAYIVPSVFHPDVSKVVAAAVKAAVQGATPDLPSLHPASDEAELIG